MNQLYLRSVLCGTVIASAAMPAAAQNDTANMNQALAAIAGFAREMCVSVSPESSSTSLELSGDARAKLDVVIAKIADLGVGGSAKYLDASSKGVLQKDLSQSYKDSNECRLRVLDVLADKLLVAETPDPIASRLPGLWYVKDDKNSMISIVVKGRSFHSTEFTRGKATATISGSVQGDFVEGTAYLEPDPTGPLKLLERTEFGMVQMRLSADGQRLVGIFTTKTRPPAVPRAVSFEWTRAQ